MHIHLTVRPSVHLFLVCRSQISTDLWLTLAQRFLTGPIRNHIENREKRIRFRYSTHVKVSLDLWFKSYRLLIFIRYPQYNMTRLSLYIQQSVPISMQICSFCFKYSSIQSRFSYNSHIWIDQYDV